ncbi:MAG: DUF4347 domain-containing protein [Thermodesulfobacteriota bacterium]|nr:DUF4347 domain-containing protein [Thermodesulfobacteriota bacterium]
MGKLRVGLIVIGLFFFGSFSLISAAHGLADEPSAPGSRAGCARAGTEIVFIDASVLDAEEIIDDLGENAEVVRLSRGRNGVEQISEYLQGEENISAIRIISHGNEGHFVLSGQMIDSQYLKANPERIASWKNALSESGDIMLYGCNIATTDEGKVFVKNLAELTDAHVGASSDLTGQGGDWDLEYACGPIGSSSLNIQGYQHHLATYTVTSTTDTGSETTTEGKLSWAIAQSNASADVDDTIAFNLSNATVVISGALPAITDSVTIDGRHAAANNVTVRVTTPGTSTFRVFNIDAPGETVNISNITINGGDISGLSSYDRYGGGIHLYRGNLNLDTVMISDSKAYRGGGISNINGTTTISNSNISNNIATSDGGGGYLNHYFSAETTITNSTINNNTASENGGGLYVYLGPVTMTACTVGTVGHSNTASMGGGIWFNGTTFALIDSTISSNQATSSDVAGAGIYLAAGSTRIQNATISNNLCSTAGGSGAGIATETDLEIVNSTITYNQTNVGGGGGGLLVNGGTTNILNSVVINNAAGFTPSLYDINNLGTVNAYHLWYDSSRCTGTVNDPASTCNDTAYSVGDLADLAYTGGFNDTVEVNAVGNVSNKAGNGTYAYYNSTDGYYFYNDSSYTKIGDGSTFTPSDPSADQIATDQRGYYRTTGGLTRGAYQYNGVVAKIGDVGWTSDSDTYTAIEAAYSAASDSDTIYLAETAIYESGITLDESKTITIQGAGVTSTYVQAADYAESASVTDRVFTIAAGEVALENMTIRYGNQEGDDGGGIRNTAMLTINNLVICDNRSYYVGEYDRTLRGGGIYNDASLTINNSAINGNKIFFQDDGEPNDPAYVAKGGGIYSGTNSSSLTINNSTIFDNLSQVDATDTGHDTNGYALGGGLCIDDNSNVTVSNSTVSRNTADVMANGDEIEKGAGIHICESSTLNIRNSIVAQNTDNGDEYDYYYVSGTLIDSGYNVVEYQSGASTGSGKTFTATTDILYNTKADGTTGYTTWNQSNSDLANQSLNLSSTLALNDSANGTYTLALEEASFATASATSGIPPESNWNNSPEIDGHYSDQRGVVRMPGQNTSIGAYSANYIPQYYYRSDGNGNWSVTGTWEQSADSITWEAASETPTDTSRGITIRNGHTVTVNTDVTIDQTTIESGATLTVDAGVTLTIADGDGTDLTANGNLSVSAIGALGINSGASVDSNAALTCSGLLSFDDGGASDGSMSIANAAPTISSLTAGSGTITYDGGDQNVPALNYCALSFAGSTSGTTKTFADGTTTINDEMTISDTITLTGSSADNVTVQVTTPGTGGTASRVFSIDASGKTVNISNMTIKGGDITGLSGAERYGGCVYVAGGTFNLQSASLSGAKATSGGGIYSSTETTASVTGSTISGNTAVGTGGGIFSAGSLVIAQSTLSGNTTSADGYGGAMYANECPNITIIDATISGNRDAYFGGIYFYECPAVSVTNSIVAYNYRTFDNTYLDVNNPGSTIYGNQNISSFAGWDGGTGNIEYVYTSGKGAALFADYDEIVADAIYKPVLADNGGPTETVALAGDAIANEGGVKTGSYAEGGATKYAFWDGSKWVKVEDGTTEVTEAVMELTTDQREADRHATPCMGAYEVYSIYTTNGAGSAWGTAANWSMFNGKTTPVATVAPTAANSTSITLEHDMTAGADVTIDQTTVNSGTTLTVNNGVTLAVGDGDGTDLTIDGTLDADGNLDMDGSISICATGSVDSDGTFDATGGSVTVTGAGDLCLGGTVTSLGTFSAGTGTVTLDGASQSIPGTHTFYNLTKTVSSADTLTFDAGSTTTVGGTLTLQGAESQLLSLRSSSGDTRWNIDPQGTRTVSYLDVKDSNNVNATVFDVSGANSTSSGNNVNWLFANAASSQDGNWSSTGTWSDGQVPIASQNVTISNSVTLDTDAEIQDLTVGSGGTLTIDGSHSLTVNGTLDASGGAIVFTGAGTLNLAGTVACDAFGTFTCGTGTVVYSAAGDQNVDDLTYYNLTLSGSGTKTLCGTVTVENTLTTGAGTTLALGSNTLNIGSANAGTGSWIHNGTFSKGTGTVNYAETGDQTILTLDYCTLGVAGTGSTKTFADGATKVDHEISLTDAITLSGSSPDNVTVQVTTPGEGGTASRVFHVNAAGKTVTINNMTIKGGDISGSSGTAGYGGGIYGEGDTTTLTVENAIITGSKAKRGGGIGVYNGVELTIENTSVSSSVSEFGGGIYVEVYSQGTGTATIRKSTVSGNTAQAGGGAYMMVGASPRTGTLNIDNSTVSGNLASMFYGGGVGAEDVGGDAVLNVNNATIAGNTVNGSTTNNTGGGIHASNADVDVTNSIIANNTAHTGADYYDTWSTTTDSGYNVVGISACDPYHSYDIWTGTGTWLDPTDSGTFTQNGTGNTGTLHLSSTLADNGGPTQTLALVAGSFAVGAIPHADAGSGAWNGSPTAGGNYYDQRGVETTAGTPISIGAYSELLTYYMAKSDGDWSSTAIWYTNTTGGTDPNDYTTAATEAPTADNSLGIIVNADVTVDADVTIDQATINNGTTLTVNNGVTLTVADGDGTDLTVDGTVDADGNLDINGSITISATGSVDSDGTFDATGGAVTFTGGGNLFLGGTITSLGAFTCGTGTVTLDGTSQSLPAGYTFYNLTKTVTSADILTFEAGSTTTVTNTLTLQGADGARLSLRSSSDGDQWEIDPQGTRTVAYLDVKDSNNTSGTPIDTVGTNSIDSGHNTDWTFQQAPTVTTQPVTDTKSSSATGNGNITDLGIPNPTSHGVVWNTAGAPTLADSSTDEGEATATGAFTTNMTGLTPNTTYAVRAYATNEEGTAYGEELSFTTLPSALAPVYYLLNEDEDPNGRRR